MRTCIEGCGNPLFPTDSNRFPESLSQSLPDIQQSVDKNAILILNMRLRCANCYNRKYNKKYYAISYRWSHENRNHSFATVTVHDEVTRAIRSGVPIPVRNQKQRAVIMNCKLFFLDVLNASSGSGQWYTSNLWRTYTSCKGVKVLLGPSDHQILEGKREQPLHQSGMTRDRDGYLRAKYGKEERASAYMQMPPEDIRFYSIYGRDMGNIEEQGLVSKEDNVYRDMFENRSHLLYGSGNTRAGGAAIAKMFATPLQKPKKKKRSQRRTPVHEQGSQLILDANGNPATQTSAYATPGFIPADLNTVFAGPSPRDTITPGFGTSLGLLPLNSPFNIPVIGGSRLGYNFEASPVPSSYHTPLNLTSISGSTLGHENEAALIPLSYNPSLDLARIGGPAQLLGPGMDLPSATTYMFSGGTGVGGTSITSITDIMSGIHISSEFGQSSDPHSNYTFRC